VSARGLDASAAHYFRMAAMIASRAFQLFFRWVFDGFSMLFRLARDHAIVVLQLDLSLPPRPVYALLVHRFY
jgi:hypothetical protein